MDNFKNKFKGDLILPRDQSNGEARQVWNRLIDKQPSLIPIWHDGGKMNRIGRKETVFGSQDRSFLFSVDSTWDEPEDSDRVIAWSRKFLEDMEPYAGDGMYVNFSGLGEEGDELVRSDYGVNYERLAKIKAKYDPQNFFHNNQNIKPSAR